MCVRRSCCIPYKWYSNSKSSIPAHITLLGQIRNKSFIVGSEEGTILFEFFDCLRWGTRGVGPLGALFDPVSILGAENRFCQAVNPNCLRWQQGGYPPIRIFQGSESLLFPGRLPSKTSVGKEDRFFETVICHQSPFNSWRRPLSVVQTIQLNWTFLKPQFARALRRLPKQLVNWFGP